MDYIKQFWKYKKLFKTKKALELFLETYQEILEDWNTIFQYYYPKSGKKKEKVNRLDLADAVFSELVRVREADLKWMCTCVTCGVVLPWTKLQAWHYRTRAHYPTRFDVRNVHCQCWKCNCALSWNYRNYHIWMTKNYPDVEDFLWCDNSIADYNQWWYEEHILDWYYTILNIKSAFEC